MKKAPFNQHEIHETPASELALRERGADTQMIAAVILQINEAKKRLEDQYRYTGRPARYFGGERPQDLQWSDETVEERNQKMQLLEDFKKALQIESVNILVAFIENCCRENVTVSECDLRNVMHAIVTNDGHLREDIYLMLLARLTSKNRTTVATKRENQMAREEIQQLLRSSK